MPEDPPIQLTILRRGDSIIVDVADHGSLIPRSETVVDDRFLTDLAAEIARLAVPAPSRHLRSDAPTGIALELQRTGGLIFSHLLTEPARRRLREAPRGDLYLRLDERLLHVPWELCHDGETFLATKFRVGRQVITGQAVPDAQPSPSRDQLRVLLVADPTETLPRARAEAEELCGVLDDVPGVEVTLLGGRGVRRIPLLAALQQHDVVHFAGHSRYDPAAPSRSGWCLDGGLLTAGELSKVRPAPLLVFSNSCEAGTTAGWEDGYRYEGHAFGIGSAFLLAGVRSYIGTFWVVHDTESVLFATTCYRGLAAGLSIGEALRRARHAVIAERGWEGLTWASYLLYGDPAFTPLVAAPARIPTVRAPERPRVAPPAPGPATPPAEQSSRATAAEPVVGRAAVLAELESYFAAARGGKRAVVFVSGSPGMGKTTLVETFLARVRAGGDTWIGQGQSIASYGAGEAYLPWLEAWNRLAGTSGGADLVEQLRRHAPSWLAQLPSLAGVDADAQRQQTAGASRERMLREMAELVEAIAAASPLVLVIEDLHWGDPSTLELMAYLAQRREPARLLLIATYRPAEALRRDAPLRAITQELLGRRAAHEIRLEPLGVADIDAYLRERLAGHTVDGTVGALVHHRTEGHPLFVVNVVDYALRARLLTEEGGVWQVRGGAQALQSRMPESLRQMIQHQVEGLGPDEQRLLEAASVVGSEFSLAEVAAALEVPADVLEELSEALAANAQMVRAAGVVQWPDGTVTARYRFIHALYRDALYERVAETRRIRFHRRIGERRVQAFGARAGEIAGELAAHFEAAREVERALSYRIHAGDNAVARHADREAADHLTHAIRLLERLPADPARAERELALLVKLAAPLMAVKGYAAREVEQVFTRAHALARAGAAGPQLFPLLRGLVSFHQVRGQLRVAETVGEELLRRCQGSADAPAIVQAHYGHGATLHDLGDLAAARIHLERALDVYDPASHATHVAVYGGYDPGVACRSWLAWIAWLTGAPDRALGISEAGMALARAHGHPLTLSHALVSSALVHLYRGESELAAERLAAGSAIARDEGFAFVSALATALDGWILLSRGRPAEAATRIRSALDDYRTTATSLARPGFLGMLGLATALTGGIDAGLGHLAEGLAEAERTEQRLHLVNLHRFRGQILLLRGDPAGAEEAAACFARALDVARTLGAAGPALQAGMQLAYLRQAQGRRAEARAILAPLYAPFTEGLETGDLRRARALLAAL